MRTKRRRGKNNARHSIEAAKNRIALLRQRFEEKVAALELRISRDESVLNDWNAGMDTEEIAAKNGVSVAVVYLIAHVNDGNVRKNHLGLVAHNYSRSEANALRRERIANLLDEGMPLNQIARQIGCSRQRVSQIIRKVRGLSSGQRIKSQGMQGLMAIQETTTNG